MVLLLMIDENKLLAGSDAEALIHLPPVEPLSESAFENWHKYSKPILPGNMKSKEVAQQILYGSQNGHDLLPTEGVIDDILENIDLLCPGVIDYIRG